MKKRDLLQGIAVGVLGLSMPAAFAAAPAKTEPVKKKFVLKGVDSSGKPVNLEDHKGKAVLVSFFTTECIPCENDMRLMREFYGENRAKNFINIGVNVNTDKQALVDYVDLIKQTIPPKQHFPIAWRRAKGHTDNFGVLSSNPTHFLLDTEHKLVTRRNGVFKGDDWDELWTSLQ